MWRKKRLLCNFLFILSQITKMERLPLETLIKIASYIPFRDRLNLALTNKTLYKLISEHTLNNNFTYAPKYYESTAPNTIIPLLADNPKYAAQVKSVTLTLPAEDYASLLSVLPYIPSIEDLALFVSSDPRDLFTNGYTPKNNCLQTLHTLQGGKDSMFQFDAWKNLKILQEIHYNGLSTLLLSSGVMPQLRKINVSFMNTADRWLELCKHLGNAPGLECLELHNCNLQLNTLEIVHQNAPNLKELYVDPIDIRDTEDTASILEKALAHPAEKLVKFRIDLKLVHQDKPRYILTQPWMMYTSRKYPNLKELYMLGDIENATLPYYYVPAMANMLSNLKNLEVHDVNICCLTPQILEAMDKSGMQLKILGIYRSSKTMPVNEQTGNLSKSKQKDSITTLSIGIVEFDSDLSARILLEKLNKFERLTNLRLSGKP